MASDIEITADADESFDPTALRDNLAALEDGDLSQSSPVTDGAPEVAVDHNRADGVVHLRVEGHDGSFTRTSQEALLGAARAVDGLSEPTVTSGGYENGTDGEE